MLPGGEMPVVHLIEIMKRTPPKSAVALLEQIPVDRLTAVLAGMAPEGVAQLLSVAPRGFRENMINMLPTEQLIAVLRVMPEGEAIELALALSQERLSEVTGNLADEVNGEVLARLPYTRRAALRGTMDPAKAFAASARHYERQIWEAFARANVEVGVLRGAPCGTFMTQGSRWRVIVAARYDDNCAVAVRDAEDRAFRMRANGALAVTNRIVSNETLNYCDDARNRGRLLAAVTWHNLHHDGQLKKAIVSLFQ